MWSSTSPLASHLAGKYIPGSKSLPQHHRVKHYKFISQSRWFFRSSRSNYLNKQFAEFILIGSLVGWCYNVGWWKSEKMSNLLGNDYYPSKKPRGMFLLTSLGLKVQLVVQFQQTSSVMLVETNMLPWYFFLKASFRLKLLVWLNNNWKNST